MYCRYCGSEIEDNIKVCPFCGKSNEKPDIVTQKDNKIQDLGYKVKRLEERLKRNEKSGFGLFKNFPIQPWIFIVPIVFVVFFFVLFFLLIRL
ncbi:MAG: zinc-ribbon domain-containing protein [Promethearchaeota archaeon]|jgi:uncharacterized membrane protein YvbJ